MLISILIPVSPKSTFSKYSFGREGGGKKKSTLCTLLIMLIIMDERPLVRTLVRTLYVSYDFANLETTPTQVTFDLRFLDDFWAFLKWPEAETTGPFLYQFCGCAHANILYAGVR